MVFGFGLRNYPKNYLQFIMYGKSWLKFPIPFIVNEESIRIKNGNNLMKLWSPKLNSSLHIIFQLTLKILCELPSFRLCINSTITTVPYNFPNPYNSPLTNSYNSSL